MQSIYKKLDFIDALRGYAILGVILVHTSQYGKQLTSTWGKLITDKGAMGVQLFFLASAFTLFLSFKKKSTFEKHATRNFFIRRLFRIAPIFYIAISYYLFQNWHSGRSVFTPGFPKSLDVFLNFCFLNGFSPYSIRSIVPGGWSIAVEFTFYAMLPFLVSKIKNEKEALNFFLISLLLRTFCITLMECYPMILDDGIWNNFLYFNFLNQLPVFALGILFYFIFSKSDNQKFHFNSFVVFLLCVFFVFQLTIGIPYFFPVHILFSVVFTLFAIALSFKQPIFLVNKIINYIGTLSFSMYIVHFAVLYWLSYFNFQDFFKNQFLNFGFKFLLVTICSVLISSVTYDLIEIPFQNVGKKIIKLWEDRLIVPNEQPAKMILHDH